MSRYTRTIAGFLLITVVLLTACKQPAVTPDPANQVKLAVNQSGRLNSGIIVRVDSLADSRCPANAVCIWEGNVMLRAVLTKETDRKSVRLILGRDLANPTSKRPDSTGVALGGTTYKVVLRAVTPFPGTGSGARSEAVIEVTPQ